MREKAWERGPCRYISMENLHDGMAKTSIELDSKFVYNEADTDFLCSRTSGIVVGGVVYIGDFKETAKKR